MSYRGETMDIGDFFKKWVYVDFDEENEEVTNAEIDLNLGLTWGMRYRSGAETSESENEDLTEAQTLLLEEQLQHPVIAMQEAEQALFELTDDLAKTWRKLDCEWFLICKLLGRYPDGCTF